MHTEIRDAHREYFLCLAIKGGSEVGIAIFQPLFLLFLRRLFGRSDLLRPF